MLKIIDKIKKENVFEDVEATDKDSLFKALSEKIASVGGHNAESIYDALLKRENEDTTGLGDAIAIPHGRVKGFGKSDVYVAILKTEIDYGARDNRPVKVIFSIIADDGDPKDYLVSLSQLIFLVKQRDIVAELAEIKNYSELEKVLKKAEELESKYETEKQIKYLIELQRADSQIYAFELYESTQTNKHESVLEEYKKYRETLEKKINPDILGFYEHIKEKYAGRALSKIDNYTCSACHIAIPKMTVYEVRRQNQILTCFNCGRILFTTD